MTHNVNKTQTSTDAESTSNYAAENVKDGKMNSSNNIVMKQEKKQLNSNDIMQNSRQHYAIDLAQKQSTTIQEQQKKKVENAQTIQKLSAENSTLKSMIAGLRAELSSTKKINQSLKTANQSLVHQNDDLRNNNGLNTRKEIEDIIARDRDNQIQNSKLKELINKSNEAVKRANAERDKTIKDTKKAKSDMKKQCDRKIRQAEKEKDAAIRQSKKYHKELKKRTILACCLHAFTLFCVKIVNKQVTLVFVELVRVILWWIYKIISS